MFLEKKAVSGCGLDTVRSGERQTQPVGLCGAEPVAPNVRVRQVAPRRNPSWFRKGDKRMLLEMSRNGANHVKG